MSESKRKNFEKKKHWTELNETELNETERIFIFYFFRTKNEKKIDSMKNYFGQCKRGRMMK